METMRVEPIPSEYVRAFWDKLWDLVTRPVQSLGGLGCFIIVLLVATVLVLVYRAFPGFRRAIHAVLVAMWMAVVISMVLIAVGGG